MPKSKRWRRWHYWSLGSSRRGTRDARRVREDIPDFVYAKIFIARNLLALALLSRLASRVPRLVFDSSLVTRLRRPFRGVASSASKLRCDSQLKRTRCAHRVQRRLTVGQSGVRRESAGCIATEILLVGQF